MKNLILVALCLFVSATLSAQFQIKTTTEITGSLRLKSMPALPASNMWPAELRRKGDTLYGYQAPIDRWIPVSPLRPSAGTGFSITIGQLQIPYAPTANTLSGDIDFQWQPGTKTLQVGSGQTQSNLATNYYQCRINGVTHIILFPGVAANSTAYKFSTSVSRTTGIHSEFSDNGKNLFRLYRDSAAIYVPLSIPSIKSDVTLTKLAGNTGQMVSVDANGKLVVLKQRKTIGIVCTTTQDATSPGTSIYAPIPEDMNGWILIRVEANFGAAQGTAVPTINISRYRSTTEAVMTSTGANFTTNATINTANDDVATGDRVVAKWTLASGTAPTGITVVLTFEKP